jgi:hypothetical protein
MHPMNPKCQLHAPVHDSHPFGMNCTQVSVLKHSNKESLRCLLQKQGQQYFGITELHPEF